MRVLLVIALAAGSTACSSPGLTGPSWPRAQAREADGGESLAPRAAARTIAAIVEDDRAVDRAVADRPSSVEAPGGVVPGASERPAVTASSASTVEEPMTTEEIVIEVDD